MSVASSFRLRWIAPILVAVASMLGVAVAHEYTVAKIKIDHPWARPTVAATQPAAVFLEIVNSGDTSDRLIGVSIDEALAKGAEIHMTSNDDGVMRMRQIADGVMVDANTTVGFEPGGRHIMLFGLSDPLSEGDRFPITLIFETAGEVVVDVAVEIAPENHVPDHSAHHGGSGS